MKLAAKFPCCNVRAEVSDRTKPQDHRCPKCKVWWRVDVRLISQNPVTGLAPGVEPRIQSMHAVEWTEIGKL